MRKNLSLLLIITLLGIFIYKEKFANKNGVSTTSGKKEVVLETVTTREITGMDPGLICDKDALEAVSKVYEGLLEYHYLKRPFEFIPNLAANMPSVSADGLTYTFTIKPGVFFHDDACFSNGQGRELVAEDFVYTFKRIADAKTQSPYFVFIADTIQELDAFRDQSSKRTTKTNYATMIAGVQALDKYSLQFKLTQPCPLFLHLIAGPGFYVVAREAVAHYGSDFVNHPVGTGPFILKKFNTQLKKLKFEKNPKFRDKFFPHEAAPAYQHMLAYAGKKLPLVDKVITHIMTEEQPRWLKFKTGKLDFLRMDNTTVALDVIEKGQLIDTLKNQKMILLSEIGVNTDFFVFNAKNKLFSTNEALRKAMSMAFDREKYNQLFYKGTAAIAQGIIPPALPGNVKGYVSPYGYNLNEAKAYLAIAGYPNGKKLPEITLDVRNETHFKQQADFFAKCMAQIGITIKVITNSWPELVKKAIKNQTTMMHAITWNADYPDAASFLSILYNGSALIGANFLDSTFDSNFKKSTNMYHSPERTAVYTLLNKKASSSIPVIYSVHLPRSVIHQGWLKNYIFSDFNFCPEQYVAIDTTIKNDLMRTAFKK